MSDPTKPSPEVDGGPSERERQRLAVLQDVLRVYELSSAGVQMEAAEQQLFAGSRLYPLAILVLRTSNVAERFLKRLLRRSEMPAVATLPPVSFSEALPAAPLAKPGGPLPARLARVFSRGVEELGQALSVILHGHPEQHRHVQGPKSGYERWYEQFGDLNHVGEIMLRRRLTMLTRTPLLSVVMATYNSNHAFLREALDSVLDQIYDRFELVIADDCSTDPEVRSIVAEYAARDPRVRLIERSENGGISAATNSAIEAAKGDWIVLMDHDDTIVRHALARIVLAIETRPSVGFVYSDEDKIDEVGRPFTPHFKTDFDPVLLLGQNYLCHLSALRADLVREVGGLRSGFDGAQDWDLFLRVTEILDRDDIVHIPSILYHWRSHDDSTSKASSAKPWALEAGTRAVAEAIKRRGIAAEIEAVGQTGFCRVHYELPSEPPLVSILIPTRDGRLLETCLTSVLERTNYPKFEIIVIDNGSVKPSTAALFERLGDAVTVLRDDSPFNYSALHNRAGPSCNGEVLLLLNDDTEIIDGSWLSHMVALLLQPGNGAVGAKLLYPDGRIQHAGVVLGPVGMADHVGKLEERNAPGYFSRLLLPSEFTACTAACLAVRRTTWERLGGLDETFEIAWNDIDFCLRLTEAGEKIAYTPLAELIHHESISRGLDEKGPALVRFYGEVQRLRGRWLDRIVRDPYYNPNLSLSHPLWEPAYPPRVSPGYTGIE